MISQSLLQGGTIQLPELHESVDVTEDFTEGIIPVM
jgi:hypothetical protein